MKRSVEKTSAILRKNGWCGILILHNGAVYALSGIADRPYCKGRAYDPNRYAQNSKEE